MISCRQTLRMGETPKLPSNPANLGHQGAILLRAGRLRCRIGLPSRMSTVGQRGDRQYLADRLALKRAVAIVDEAIFACADGRALPPGWIAVSPSPSNILLRSIG
jgi:hypothetical protein